MNSDKVPGVGPAFFQRKAILAYFVCGGIAAALFTPLIIDADHLYPFSGPKGFWFIGSVELAFAAWALLACIEEKYRPRIDMIFLGMLACIFFDIVSAFCGPDAGRSFWSSYERMSGVVMRLHLFGFFLVLASFLKSTRDWHRVFAFSTVVASVVSLPGLIFHLAPDFALIGASKFPFLQDYLVSALNPGSTFGNTSFMGSYLLINAFLSIYLLRISRGRTKLLLGLVVLLLIFGILFNSGGRAMKVALLVGLAMIWIMAAVRLPGRRVWVAAAITFAIVTLFVVAFIRWDEISSLIMGIEGVPVRLTVWKMAWTGFLDRPLLGWGAENFDLVFYKYFDPGLLVGAGLKSKLVWFDKTHNAVLELLVSGGILGLITHCFVPIASIFYLWRYSRKSGGNGILTAIVFSAMFSAHFIQNLSVFDTTASQMLIFVAFAFASRMAPKVEIPGIRSLKMPSQVLKSLIALTAVAVSIFAFWNCVQKPMKISREVGVILSTGPEEPLLEKYIDVSKALVVGKHDTRVMLSEMAAKRLENLSENGEADIRIREAQFILSSLEESSVESPGNFRVLYESGLLNSEVALAVSSGPESNDDHALNFAVQAETSFQKSIEVSPRHVLARLGLARSLIYQGFLSDDSRFHSAAYEVVDNAIKIEPGLFDSHKLAIDIANDLLEDDELSSQILKRAELIDLRWIPRLSKRKK
ncbi:O-antigen ligase family protein [bacterium]|nr:O-antigen ligase family protein [bacterium]